MSKKITGNRIEYYILFYDYKYNFESKKDYLIIKNGVIVNKKDDYPLEKFYNDYESFINNNKKNITKVKKTINSAISTIFNNNNNTIKKNDLMIAGNIIQNYINNSTFIFGFKMIVEEEVTNFLMIHLSTSEPYLYITNEFDEKFNKDNILKYNFLDENNYKAKVIDIDNVVFLSEKELFSFSINNQHTSIKYSSYKFLNLDVQKNEDDNDKTTVKYKNNPIVISENQIDSSECNTTEIFEFKCDYPYTKQQCFYDLLEKIGRIDMMNVNTTIKNVNQLVFKNNAKIFHKIIKKDNIYFFFQTDLRTYIKKITDVNKIQEIINNINNINFNNSEIIGFGFSIEVIEKQPQQNIKFSAPGVQAPGPRGGKQKTKNQRKTKIRPRKTKRKQ
jgi:hypothetical protein